MTDKLSNSQLLTHLRQLVIGTVKQYVDRTIIQLVETTTNRLNLLKEVLTNQLNEMTDLSSSQHDVTNNNINMLRTQINNRLNSIDRDLVLLNTKLDTLITQEKDVS